MREINDLFYHVNSFLSTQPIINQCLITDYTSKDGISTCTVLLPKVQYLSNKNQQKETSINSQVLEFKNITCYLGTVLDITFQDYMQGILINLQNSHATAQEISTQKVKQKYDYYNIASDNLIAIILPHSETIQNLLTLKLQAQESLKIEAPKIYLGDNENNLLQKLTEYVEKLEDFFKTFSEASPNLSSYPANGSATMQQKSAEMQNSTKEFYNIIKKISDYEEKE